MSRRSTDLLAPTPPTSGALRQVRDALWGVGHAVIPDFLSSLVLDVLSAEADALVRDADAHAPSITGLDARSELLFEFARTDAFTGLAADLIGKAVVPIGIEYAGTPLSSSAPTRARQDQAVHDEHFDDERALVFWCPLQQVGPGDAAPEYAAPTSPYGQLLPHRSTGSGFELAEVTGMEFAAVSVPRGACVVHHSYAVHRSGPLINGRQRRAFAFRYRGSSYRESLRQGMNP